MIKRLPFKILIALLFAPFLMLAEDSFDGGVISLMNGTTETKICVGDGIPDPLMIMLMDAEGPYSTWVVTDLDGKILGIQESNTFDLEGAGAGTCLIWHMGYKDIVGKFEVGMNKDNVAGWLDYSNPVTIVREPISASVISVDGETELSICIDGIPDPIEVDFNDGISRYKKFLVTDEDLNILAITSDNKFDFEGAGVGTCIIWRLSFNNIFGNVVGLNAADLGGCFMLSNPITVRRQAAAPSFISLGNEVIDLSICAGDGVSDAFTPEISEGEGEFNAWVITDEDLNILGLPSGPTIDLEGAGEGTCLLWYVNYNGTISGLDMGANAADLSGCFALSNAITIVRNGVAGGSIEIAGGGDSLSICAGDGVADPFTVTTMGVVGDAQQWVITDTDLNILGLPSGPTFDLEGAGGGTCLVWHLSYNGELSGAEVGLNAGDLEGCLSLSNPITVIRNGIEASSIMTDDGLTEFSICAGDGIADPFTVLVDGESGDASAWIITDEDLNILGLPAGPTFDLEGAGTGTCLLWYANYNDILSGVEVGANVADIDGCFALSNPITISRNGVSGGEIALSTGGVELEICAGDGVSDAFEVNVADATGESSAWVITDTDLNILGLPEGPTSDLEGAGAGTCLLWNVSFNGDLTGAEVGMNAADLGGCFSLSNAITVTRNGVEGAVINIEGGGTETRICAGDGVADPFTAIVEGGIGENSAWVITDADLNILGLPEGPTFDLEGAGLGLCLVWHISFNGELAGAEVGANVSEVSGCFALSNSISVTRTGVNAPVISIGGGGTELEICAGDGISDAFDVVFEANDEVNSFWIITDADLNILALPEGSNFDLEGAGEGTCLIWYVNAVGDISGVEVGLNAGGLEGCFALSNPITVTRNGVAASAITIEGGGTELEICAGDGVSDAFTAVIEGGEGNNNAWLITDSDLNILGLPDGPTFDLEGAGNGTCLVWNLNYSDGLAGLEIGANAGDLVGCFALSNAITVTRNGVSSAEIAIAGGATEISICAGDGISDAFETTVEGGEGAVNLWVITDEDLNILGLPEGPIFDLEGAGAGVCLIWYVSANGEVTGLEVGLNAGDLVGCFALSNPITVTRQAVSAATISLEGGGTELSICAGDGIADMFTANIEGGSGESSAWVITDADLNILGLPEGPSFDLDGAGAGTCLLWYLNYNGELTGLDVGSSAGELSGCFVLSNAITVERSGVAAASLALEDGATELSICAGDGSADPFTPVVEGGSGMNSRWIITDSDLNILGIPDGPTFDLDGAGEGVCLLWYLSYNGEVGGVSVGANAADFVGCFALSNAITVTRTGVGAATIDSDLGTSFTICAGDGIGDPFTATVEGGLGEFSGWVITDTLGMVLGLPAGPTFDLDGAGSGVCQVWYFNSAESLDGIEVGDNVGDIETCFALSNPITVTREGISSTAISLEGGIVETDICVGNGLPDLISPLEEGGEGERSAWIITDADSIIVGLPFAPPFNLEGAGAGTCLIWKLNYNGNIFNIDLGLKATEIEGCAALSNAITVRRSEVEGGVLALEDGTDALTICAGDNVSDAFNVTLDSVLGENSAWVITDADLNILGLPTEPPFDLEGAGGGVCLLWHLSFNGEIMGAAVDANAADLSGCFELSNPITVTRVTEGDLCSSGLLRPEDVELFPNPSDEFINIGMNSVLSESISIRVYDAFGRLILTKNQMNKEDMKIDVRDLGPGVYYMNIIQGQESMLKEFIKI